VKIIMIEEHCRKAAEGIDQQGVIGLFFANAFSQLCSRFAKLPVNGSSFSMLSHSFIPAWIIRTMSGGCYVGNRFLRAEQMFGPPAFPSTAWSAHNNEPVWNLWSLLV
jgi:hypothetical protein